MGHEREARRRERALAVERSFANTVAIPGRDRVPDDFAIGRTWPRVDIARHARSGRLAVGRTSLAWLAHDEAKPAVVVARKATHAVHDRGRALELAARSQGAPLETARQARLAAMFDHPLEHVRVHTDGAAREAAGLLGARAFAIGAHVYFADGEVGDELLVHELAHVVQHDRGRLAGEAPRVSEPGDALERDADALADAALARAPGAGAVPLFPAGPAPVYAQAPRTIAPGVAPVLRAATGTLDGSTLTIGTEHNGAAITLELALTSAQEARFTADPKLAQQLADEVERSFQSGGKPRFESARFLSSSAIGSRLTGDLDSWLGGRGLPTMVGLLDERERALRNLHLLEPLERHLASIGIEPGTIDWAAAVPLLLAEAPPTPPGTLIDASVEDRYHLFYSAIGAEAAARPAITGGSVPAGLGTKIRDYVDHLPSSAFGDGVSVFSEAFLAKWSLELKTITYMPAGFDLAAFDPSGKDAELEAERKRVLDDFETNRAPNLLVQYVRDDWATSGMTEDGYLAHRDMAALKKAVVAKMADDFAEQAKADPAYRRALRSAANQRATFAALRTVVGCARVMELTNAGLAERFATTPMSEVDDGDRAIAADPKGYFDTCKSFGDLTTSVLGRVQAGGDLGAALLELPATPQVRGFNFLVGLSALGASIDGLKKLKTQQDADSRKDLMADLELRYPDVARIVQTMWDDAEAFIRDQYIPALKRIALAHLKDNRDEIQGWLDDWPGRVAKLCATYRMAAWFLNDVAGKLESGEVSIAELQGQRVTKENAGMLRQGATAMTALAAKLESPEGGSAQKADLQKAVEVFDGVSAKITDGTYKPQDYGKEIAGEARAACGIGEFPEYTSFGQVLTGAVSADRNPFLARAITGWVFRTRLEDQFKTVAKFVGLGLVTVASLVVPGVGGVILMAADIGLNIWSAAVGVGKASDALDLALLDTHGELQGISVEQARAALHHAWIGMAVSLVVPLGLAAVYGVLRLIGNGAITKFAELPFLKTAIETDAITTERLLRIVNDPVKLNKLLKLAGEARRLDGIILFAGDLAKAERLLVQIKDPVKLYTWLQQAVTGDRMLSLIKLTPSVEKLEVLINGYAGNLVRLERDLASLGTGVAAGARLDQLMTKVGGAEKLLALADRCDSMLQLDRLVGRVDTVEKLGELLGVLDGKALTTLLERCKDVAEIDALLGSFLPAGRLAGAVEAAETGERLRAILGHVKDLATFDGLTAAYGNDLVLAHKHLGKLGEGTAAGDRLLVMVKQAGDGKTLERLLGHCKSIEDLEACLKGIPNGAELEPILKSLGGARTKALIAEVGDAAAVHSLLASLGEGAGREAFLKALDADAKGAVAIGKACQGTPGIAGALAEKYGAGLTKKVAIEGATLSINGEISLLPQKLGELGDKRLKDLLTVCDNPKAPAVDELAKGFERDFRWRFKSRLDARAEAWVTKLVDELKLKETPKIFETANMSASDREGLWLIGGKGTRGDNPVTRPAAAKWALGRNPANARVFAADFQFFIGEVDQEAERIAAAIDAKFAVEAAKAKAAQGGAELSAVQKDLIYKKLTAEPVENGGIGQAYNNVTGKNARNKIKEVAAARAGAGGADTAKLASEASLTGGYAPGSTTITIDPGAMVADVKARASTINFGSMSEASYHAHVHIQEIPKGDLVAGGNEVQTYINTARETVRSGSAAAPTLSGDGKLYSITFSRGGGIVIVKVQADNGVASMATYIPMK